MCCRITRIHMDLPPRRMCISYKLNFCESYPTVKNAKIILSGVVYKVMKCIVLLNFHSIQQVLCTKKWLVHIGTYTCIFTYISEISQQVIASIDGHSYVLANNTAIAFVLEQLSKSQDCKALSKYIQHFSKDSFLCISGFLSPFWCWLVIMLLLLHSTSSSK